MARSGECLAGCGKCCEWLTVNVNPQYYTNPDAKYWAETRGIRVRMTKEGFCFMDIPLPCPALDGTRCSLHGTPAFPKECAVWPASQADINLIHDLAGEEVCGYSFKED